MNIIEIASFTLVFVAFIAFAGKRLLTYMHVLQQEDYYNGRLFSWMMQNGAFDKRVSFVLILLGGLTIGLHVADYDDMLPQFFLNFMMFIIFVIGAYVEIDPRKSSKKKLVSTARAKRIFVPAFIIAVLSAVPYFFGGHPFLWVVNIQLLPFLLILVNVCLQPFEEMIQKGFWDEAHNKVLDYQPKVIGITGSYGKTSIKHILGHILKTQAPTLITPGSVNTPMGITRVIREELEPTHQFLIVEMGAYGPGSIGRLCRLTPPDVGVIASIGHAHYERFKSLDTVAQAKFELAEAVIRKDPEQGKTIIHERTLRFSHVRKLKAAHPKNFIVAGDSPNPTSGREVTYIQPEDLQIRSIDQRKNGLCVTFEYKKVIYSPDVPIFGIHHGHNIALAFATAIELGVDSADIQDAMASMPQIQHRLEVKRQPDGTTLIDDAYNSNPIGFQSALTLLSNLGASGRKILITPGMVELGVAHGDAHDKIGRSAGEICDICLVVAADRIPTFVKGFKAAGSGKTLLEFDSFHDAQNWFVKNKQSGDIVLIENDLPDMYERIPKM
ncbi:MAG: Mur ligase family protein [Bdellovibrionales bacterium]